MPDAALTLVLYNLYAHVSVRNFGPMINIRAFRSRRPGGGSGRDIVGELADSWTIETGPGGTIFTTRIRRDPP